MSGLLDQSSYDIPMSFVNKKYTSSSGVFGLGFVLGGFILSITLGHIWSIHASEKPNIIFFLVDDMGWQDTSVPFWNKTTPFNQHFRTPNMERLAKQGRRFTQAYACAVCSPTRTSIMTGQNAARHRVTNWTLYEDRETSGKLQIYYLLETGRNKGSSQVMLQPCRRF